MKRSHSALLATSLLLVATSASAHPGHDAQGLMAGLTHPFTGLDHLLAMLAIGIWSARQSRALTLATPLLMVVGMLAGAGIALLSGGQALHALIAEQGILLSVLASGALVALLLRLPTLAGAVMVAGFMACHGFAHALEMPAAGSAAGYMAGFVVATLALALLGRAIGQRLMGVPAIASRLVGGAVMASAVMMAV
ncbi:MULTISPECIES: HupE/UreJ family protein [Cobetia]|uniref:HupE/UreJ family protein n=1 Tax=Cobetia TaxID=204286 RepID=UPI00158385BB|nr:MULTISPECIES: HupE/UreJ family protein [Cobetia]MBS4155339.1 HupE/UreJ family protein [Cobetia sp. MC34]MDI4660224.1 HupE/UreJ family protein [Cobetia sp. BMC6]NUJ56438.1 HupE/UreJ family protein [Cobetia marina]